jgi:hypothetical protein
VLAACGDDGGGGGALASGADAGRRVKERTVSVRLQEVAERELIEMPDGGLELGAIRELPDARRCLSHRREAFAFLGEFEALDPPLCADAEGLVEGVPPDKDFIVTVDVEDAGLLPASYTLRTDAFDLSPPAWVPGQFFTAVVREDALAPWIEPSGALGPGEGLLIVFVAMIYDGPRTDAQRNGAQLGARRGVSNVALGEGTEIVIDPAGEGAPIALRARRDRPLFVRVPVGSARVRFDHAGLNCQPVGVPNDWPVAGLPVERQGEIEVPVLAGRTTGVAMDCFCVARPDDGPLMDHASCTFAPRGADAGAP